MRLNVPIESLLRKVKLAAAKLNLMQLEVWVDQELQGYSGDVPDYRKVSATALALNPIRGWIPLGGDHKTISYLSTRRISHSVSQLRDLIQDRGKGSEMIIRIDSGVEANILARLEVPMSGIGSAISRSSFVGILDKVRSRVLDRAIEVEKAGVKGEGLTFTREEKLIAGNTMTTFNIGSIGNFAGNLGSNNSSGDISLNSQQITKAKEVIKQVRDSLPALVEAGVSPDFEKIVDLVEAEIISAQPNKQKLSGLITDARNAVSGATGSLLATGALAALTSLAQLL